MDKYVERLLKEWTEHKKIIISCDFDSTLKYWNTINNHQDMGRTIELIKKAQSIGCYLVIFTASEEERYPEILKYCSDVGLVVDCINKNPFPMKYGNSGKIYANIYLDDRAGLVQSLDILEETMKLYEQNIKLSIS
jgi:hypothetical protein